MEYADETDPATSKGGQKGIKKTKKPKLAHAGASGGARYVQGPGLDWTKILLIAAVIILVLGGIITAIVVAVSNSNTTVSVSMLRYFGKLACDEDDTPTAYHINECLKSRCPFDLTTCSSPCPFGFHTDESGCEISCECASEGNFEGDIFFDEDQLPQLTKLYGYVIENSDFNTNFDVMSGSAVTGNKLWNDKERNGRYQIPYVMLPAVTKKAKQVIMEAMARYKKSTCIDFVERTTEARYFRLISGKGCFSSVGKYHKNGQVVSIGQGCEYPGIVQHEFLHLLGFFHEHTRPDRDSYITVVEANIAKGQEGNFKKRMKSEVRTFDSEYDLGSILQYPSEAFTTNGKPTLLKAGSGETIRAQRVDFSKEDLYEVNSLYNCFEQIGTAIWTEWTKWSSCDETCGSGSKARFRKCQDPDAQSVKGCKGNKMEKLVCQNKACPKKSGKWNKWGQYTDCSSSCGGGFHWRRRKCDPYGQCNNVAYQGKACNSDPCEGGPSWGKWSAWGDCSRTCEYGEQTRKRQCFKADNTPAITCEDVNSEGIQTGRKDCNTDSCDPPKPGDWGPWSSCSSSCDGTRTRTRPCEQGSCQAQNEEEESCNDCEDEEPAMFETGVVETPQILCDKTSGNSWYFGDFSGDKRADAMCSNTDGTFKVGHTGSTGVPDKVDWQGKIPGCSEDQIFVGDFNGDGKDDLLCRDEGLRKLTIKLATAEGVFDPSTVDAGNFCTDEKETLRTFDINGDGKVDLVCHFIDKKVEVRLNQYE